MNSIRILPLLAVLMPGAVIAATIDTSLFTIEVPDSWQIQDNKRSTILLMGSKVVDGMPSPFLSIQYCAASTSLKLPEQSLCAKTCEEEAKTLTSNDKPNSAEFSPVNRLEKEKGVIEYSVELQSPVPISALQTLSCSSSGQTHVGLVTDDSQAVAKQLFEKIVKSLKWK